MQYICDVCFGGSKPGKSRGKKMSKRVALAGFLHETNTFAPTKALMADFVQGGGYMPLARGQALVDQSKGINLGIGGDARNNIACDAFVGIPGNMRRGNRPCPKDRHDVPAC